MRVRTFLSILVALSVVVVVAYLSNQNVEVLGQPFALTDNWYVPLYAALLVVFLLGFLPVVTILLIQTLKQELARRRQRRFEREETSWRRSFRRAIDLQEDHQWARAAEELERVLADQPDDFSTLLRYGEVLRHQGRLDDALDVHRRASVLYPQSTAILNQLIADYEAQGDSEVAAQIRERLIRDFPGAGLKALRLRRSKAMGQRDWATTRQIQEKIDAIYPADKEAPPPAERAVRHILAVQKGVELVETDQLEPARKIFQSLASENPASTPVQMMLGEISSLEGDSEAALELWQGVFETTGSAMVLQRIEDHFIERGEPIRAIETLRGLIAAADDDLLPRFFLGQLYARLEMRDEALKVLAGIRGRVQDSPAFFNLLGQLKDRRGETAEALEAYRTTVQHLGLSSRRYVCGACGTASDSWDAICDACGIFGLVDLQIDLEPHRIQEPRRGQRPTWPVYERKDEI